jgi:uncharacterized protein YjbJ (UPF0337 family)
MQKEQSVDMKSGAQDKIEGTLKNFAGTVKKDTGKALGNPRLEAQGNSDQVKGNAQKRLGEIKKVFSQ